MYPSFVRPPSNGGRSAGYASVVRVTPAGAAERPLRLRPLATAARNTAYCVSTRKTSAATTSGHRRCMPRTCTFGCGGKTMAARKSRPSFFRRSNRTRSILVTTANFVSVDAPTVSFSSFFYCLSRILYEIFPDDAFNSR